MDVKSAFLYGTIEEEVNVTQLPGFKDPDHPDKFTRWSRHLWVASSTMSMVYVDDIIFGSTNNELCTGFEKLMKDKFQMSSMGELTFFLGSTSSGPRCQDTILGDVNAQTRFETTSKQFIDPPLSRGYTLRSGEDINPVIYTSCIEQFWATAKVQTVNGVRQLQALVDKKRVIVTDAKSIAWNEFSSSMVSLIICLATNQKFNLSKYIFDAMVKHLDGGVKFLLYLRFLLVFINQQLEEDPEIRKEENVKTYRFEKTQESCIKDIDVDVSLVDETQERQDDDLMFDFGSKKPDDSTAGEAVTTASIDDSTVGEAVTTASIDDSVVPTTKKEITLDQTLIHIKVAKPKVVTTATTIETTTRPKDRGVVIQEPSEFRVPQETQPSSSKDKGKCIMIEPEVPLKRKDQIALDEQIARDIQAKLDAELLEEQNLARKKE
ncbi:hypothetical protein Tco_0930308 [Tanacetum coccineum]